MTPSSRPTAPDRVPPTSDEPPDRSEPPDLVGAARRVAAELAQRAERHDREGSYAPENIAAIWDAGLGNLALPAELGGSGADLATACRVVEALAAGDASTTLIFVMHQNQLRQLSDEGGAWPAPIRQRLVAESLAGPALVNALRVEPELGTPARGGVPATRATPARDGAGRPIWRISGRKIYSTGSYGLRWMAVWAATPTDDPDGPRVGAFLVPGRAPGVEIVETWDHLGMRASASHDVVFHDVAIPFEDTGRLQPVTGTAAPAAPDLAQEAAAAGLNVLLLSLYLGVAQAGRDWLAGYLNERTPSNLGAPLATLPRFQAAVGEIESLLYTSEQLVASVAAALDGRGPDAERTARGAGLAKVVVTANVIRSLELALSLIGNPGLTMRHPLQRFYRDALCSRVHTPQDDVILTGAGRTRLGR